MLPWVSASHLESAKALESESVEVRRATERRRRRGCVSKLRGSATPVNLHVPYHRVRNTVLEALPRWRGYGYVIGIVNAPVGAGKDLLRLIGINNDGVHRNVREIAGLIRPGEGPATGSACYLEHVTRCRWRVSVEPANSRIPNREICGRHRRIERNAKHRAIGQDRVVSSDVYPVRLCLSARAKIEADPCIAVVRANNRDALIFR